jgi:hypothetical protein
MNEYDALSETQHKADDLKFIMQTLSLGSWWGNFWTTPSKYEGYCNPGNLRGQFDFANFVDGFHL